jgi:hypothetical protein
MSYHIIVPKPVQKQLDDVDLIKAIYTEIETVNTLDDLRRVYQ